MLFAKQFSFAQRYQIERLTIIDIDLGCGQTTTGYTNAFGIFTLSSESIPIVYRLIETDEALPWQ